MIYSGIYYEREIPKTAVSTELAEEFLFHGKVVRTFHVWMPEPKIGLPFGEDEEPNKPKIKAFERFWRNINE